MAGRSVEERLVEMLTACQMELLRERGTSPQLVQAERRGNPEGESIAAFIGFGNQDIRGSIAVFGQRELFARLHPLPPTIEPRDLVDWACELVNQTVGRMRNRLLAFGVSLAFSVPQSALARELRLSSSFHPARSPISLSIDGMVMETWMELELRPGFEMPDAPSNDKGLALQEGSVVIF
jgi:hypothetical protein